MEETQDLSEKKEIPTGLWTKCTKCEQIIFQKELDENFKNLPQVRFNASPDGERAY